MKGVPKIILTILLFLVWIGIAVSGYLYWKDNSISEVNRLKEQVEENFYDRQYVESMDEYAFLIDSLGLTDDALRMNYANAALLSAELLRNELSGLRVKEKKPDSTLQLLEGISEREYAYLTGSSDNRIASFASNQRGYQMVKVDHLLRQPNADSLLGASLEYFKDALRKYPENESARYNFELISRLAAYPQTVIKNVQSLVDEQRYREAAEYLEGAMRRNASLNKQKEFLDRLKQIVKIDSIYGRSR
jgi:Ca-activated chloride channel homolog